MFSNTFILFFVVGEHVSNSLGVSADSTFENPACYLKVSENGRKSVVMTNMPEEASVRRAAGTISYWPGSHAFSNVRMFDQI